ncbi:hypothetical protein D3C76_859070 [compost metagenome]
MAPRKRLNSPDSTASSSRPRTGRREPRSASPAASCRIASTTASSGRAMARPSSRIRPPARSMARLPSNSSFSASAFTAPSTAALGRAAPNDQGVAVSPMATGTASMKTSSPIAGEMKRRVREVPLRTASVMLCRCSPRKSASVSASLRPTRVGSGWATRVVSWAVSATAPTPSGRNCPTRSCSCAASRPMPRRPTTRPSRRTGSHRAITDFDLPASGRERGGEMLSRSPLPSPIAVSRASRCAVGAGCTPLSSRSQNAGCAPVADAGRHQTALAFGLLRNSDSSSGPASRRSSPSSWASMSAVIRAACRAPSK